ncbi:MAG: hypothetical protein ABJM36_08160 [Algibacter sp.]|uniref:hypothetical protein n=1 Tax=Algibacter sp. TaxID=1872428 RepID=UPI0032989011
MKNIILIVLTISFNSIFIFAQNTEFDYLNGTLLNAETNEGIPFVGINITINNQITSCYSTDFDGHFKANLKRKILNTDKIQLEIEYVNFNKTITLEHNELEDFQFKIKVNNKLTTKKIAKWRSEYFKKKLDCLKQLTIE